MAEFEEKREPCEGPFERIDTLVSLLVDEAISDHELKELEALLLDQGEMRQRYIDGIRLHVDLIDFYRGDKGEALGAQSPILTMLGESSPGSPDESGVHLPTQRPHE